MPAGPFLELGERLTRALLTGDFALYRHSLTLPVKFIAQTGGAYELASETALKEDFDLYVGVLKLHGVTDIYRQLRRLDATSADATCIYWTTHILARANLLTEPFPTRMLVRLGAEGWRIAEIESSEGHLNWTQGKARLTREGRFES